MSGSSGQALVDVVIAVHTPQRPIERAVASVLEHTIAHVRVLVVVHNTDVAPILARLDAYAGDERVRVVEFRDGIPSPSGPMNRGFDLAEAEFVSLLGSDDEFEPGAIDAWLATARRDRAEVVVSPIRFTSGRALSTPPVRLGRRSGLSGAKDRLAYRTAPLGLISRARLATLRFPVGLETGEDQLFTASLWFSSARVSFPVRSPGYLVHEDGEDRVTGTARTVAAELEAVDGLLADGAPWLRSPGDRLALLVKVVRVHVFDAFRNRADAQWDERAAEELAAVIGRILLMEPLVPAVLSRAENGLLSLLLRPGSGLPELRRADQARSRLRTIDALRTPRLRHLLHRQAPLRLRIAGSAVVRRVRPPAPRGGAA